VIATKILINIGGFAALIAPAIAIIGLVAATSA
jgi:hypothetical protein